MNLFIGDNHPASVVFHQLPASVCFIDCQHRLSASIVYHQLSASVKTDASYHPNLLNQVMNLREPDLSGLRSSAYE
jgi:hypothetical protein